jgi:cellulose biosynthesis protein BcsQ
MPQSIAFVSQTGNVMKSTLAAAMGLTLAAAGLDILAVDLDPEHRARGASLSTWLTERRQRHPDRTHIDVVAPETANEALHRITQSPADIVIIDCPSRATEASFLIAASADFTILPLVPGEKDAVLTVSTLTQLIATGIDPNRLAVILTRTGTDAEAQDYRAWLTSAGLGPIHIIDRHIPERVADRNALTRRFAITEAQPTSVRVQACRSVDALIAAFDRATTKVHQPQLEGPAS